MKRFIVLSLLISSLLGAETLETTTVTASKTKEQVKEIPKEVVVVTKKQIVNSGATSLKDVLKDIPGITVGSGYTGGGIVDVRGQGESAKNNTIILVNGVSQNTADMSGVDLSRINLNNVKKIEYIPGGGVLYGDKAIGGVINIITEDNTSIGYTTGSYGRKDFDVSLSFGNEGWKVFGTYQDNSKDGMRDNSDYNKETYSIGTQIALGEYAELKYNLRSTEGKYNFPGSLKKNQLNDISQSLSGKGSTDYTQKDSNIELAVTYGTLQWITGLNVTDKETNYNYGYFKSESKTDKTDLTTKFVVDTENTTIVTGVDYAKTGQDIKGKGIDKEQVGAYYNQKLKYKNLDFVGGYREEKVNYNYFDKEKKEYNQKLGQIGLVLNFDKIRLFANQEAGYRTPTTDEIYNSYMDTYSDLKPQSVTMNDLGIELTPFKGQLIKVTYFDSETENELFYNPDTWSNENMKDKTNRSGMTYYIKNTIGPITFANTYSTLDAKIDGKRIPWTAKEKFNSKLSLDNKGFGASVTYNYTGDMYSISDWDNSLDIVKAYSTLDTNVYFNSKYGKIYGGVNNIGDTKYYDYVTYGSNFYPSEGKTYYVGVRIEK